MTDPRADKYSHTPRRVFDRSVDRADAKRQRISGQVRVLKDEILTLQDQMALMRATLGAIHDKLFPQKPKK